MQYRTLRIIKYIFLSLIISYYIIGCAALNKHNPGAILFTPYIGPYLTILTPELSGTSKAPTVLNPTTNMVVNYEIKEPSLGFQGQVYYREIGSNYWLTELEETNTDSDKSWDEQTDINWGKVHHVVLSKLSPDTQYEYYVISANNIASKVYQFKTAKSNFSGSRFLIIGDMQDENSGQRWQEIADSISSNHMEDFDFIISVGDMAKDDMSEQDDRFYWWKLFFDKGQSLLSQKPILPALGNHDTPTSLQARSNQNCGKEEALSFPSYCSNADDSRSYRKYFNIHPNRHYPEYFSFAYGNACFISVNTEISAFYGRYPELDKTDIQSTQIEWLKDIINQHQSCEWSIVYHHIPVIQAATGKEDEIVFTRPYADLFEHNIDWSISGHLHQYQRLNPIIATSETINLKTSYGKKVNQGVGYMIAAPAGQWPRNNRVESIDLVASYAHNNVFQSSYEIGYSIVNISGNDFQMKTYGMGSVGNQTQPDGYRKGNDRSLKLIDSLSYKK